VCTALRRLCLLSSRSRVRVALGALPAETPNQGRATDVVAATAFLAAALRLTAMACANAGYRAVQLSYNDCLADMSRAWRSAAPEPARPRDDRRGGRDPGHHVAAVTVLHKATRLRRPIIDRPHARCGSAPRSPSPRPSGTTSPTFRRRTAAPLSWPGTRSAVRSGLARLRPVPALLDMRRPLVGFGSL
jgi:hypothetical protein